MNRYFIILALLIFVCFNVQAQSNYHNIHYLDPYNPEYVKGEVLVKFKDAVEVKTALKSGVALTGVTSVDELLQVYQPEAVTKIFKETREQRQQKTVRTIRDFKGKEIEVPPLYNIYKLKFDTVWDAKQIIEELQKDENVEFAEPNYLVYTSEVIESGVIPDQAPTLNPLPTNKGSRNTSPNDPLYANGSQWYLDAINAPAAWDSVTGDTTQIIAIIDTGVDWDHPDLDDNIWTNWNEIPDNGIDDDNNGYIDDTRGWDYINNDNDPNDDNSHGTHVAGIAAAEGNNEIGICGVAWNAQIMPVKMLQSSGSGNSSDLASAIEYASENGATVINMSLGSYGESLTVKTALENAYAGTGDGEGSMLVAAAGNDSKNIEYFPDLLFPMFPAAYNFVLGVVASKQNNQLSSFSNDDLSGPILYEGNRGFNYEVMAPGLSIISCKPNGSYWLKSGTSMASPSVAGAVALMRQYQPDDSGEEVFAKLIQNSNSGLIDIYNSLTTSLIPNLFYINYTIIDTLPGCDNDGIADAGETIQLYLTVKNGGGQADSVWAKIRFATFEDTTTANIIDSTSSIGSMSAYSLMTGELDPFFIEINEDVANYRDIIFEYEIGAANQESILSEIAIKIQNGFEVGGIIVENETWFPHAEYLITENLRVASNVTLNILPGTIVTFWPETEFDIRGSIIATGTKDSLIVFKPIEHNSGKFSFIVATDTSRFKYCQILGLESLYPYVGGGNSYTIFEHCIIEDFDRIFNLTFSPNSKIEIIYSNILISRPNYLSCIGSHLNGFPSIKFSNLVFKDDGFLNFRDSWGHPSLFENNVISDFNQNITLYASGNEWINFSQNYFGATEISKISPLFYDFTFESSLPEVIFAPILTNPVSQAHGIVKDIKANNISINKIDNPYNLSSGLGIIGAETLQFDVHFNRAMDTSYTPLLTFGVREPYAQHIIAASASWSADSTIWTAYRAIDASTGDGIQRVRVANARDNERFEIPIENYRFEFVIQAAAAASIEFYATPGIGKVELEWPPTPSDDALGYNLYRYYNLTDSTYSDTLMINTELILDTLFTDYSVIPDTTYHYLYKTLGTDMVETDYSKKATATPFIAATGDANGDMTVNVLDITTIVSYILNQNPQPFLSDAADVNYDGQVNLLDIIGVVNLIMNNKAVSDRPYPMISQQKAYYEWRGHELWLHSDGNLAGLQFELTLPENLELDQLRIKSRLPGFEMASEIHTDNIQGLLFSLDGKTIPAGETCLLELIGAELPAELQFASIIGGELVGDLVEVLPYGIDDLPEQGAEQQMLQVQPNPFSHQLLINWDVPEANKVALRLYDQQGRLVQSLYEGNEVSGSIYWEGKDQHNKSVSKGVYILKMETYAKGLHQQFERKIIFN